MKFNLALQSLQYFVSLPFFSLSYCLSFLSPWLNKGWGCNVFPAIVCPVIFWISLTFLCLPPLKFLLHELQGWISSLKPSVASVKNPMLPWKKVQHPQYYTIKYIFSLSPQRECFQFRDQHYLCGVWLWVQNSSISFKVFSYVSYKKKGKVKKPQRKSSKNIVSLKNKTLPAKCKVHCRSVLISH